MVFSQIYKAAVNDCVINEKLKNELVEKAGEYTKDKHKIRPLYRYSFAAAAVVLLMVSLNNAPGIIDKIHPENTENKFVQTIVNEPDKQENESDILQDISEPDTSVVTEEAVTATADMVEKEMKSDNDVIEESEKKNTQKQSQNLKNTSSDKSADKKSKDADVKPETENMHTTNEELKKQSADIKEDAVENSVLAPAQEAVMNTDEVTLQTAEAAYTESEEDETGAVKARASGGGGGGSSAVSVSGDKAFWTLTDYTQYIGVDLKSKIKVPEGFSDNTEQRRSVEYDENKNPLNDEWVFSYAADGQYINIITSKKVLDYDGDLFMVNGVAIYKNSNVYSLCYQGIGIQIVSGNVSHEQIVSIISALVK